MKARGGHTEMPLFTMCQSTGPAGGATDAHGTTGQQPLDAYNGFSTRRLGCCRGTSQHQNEVLEAGGGDPAKPGANSLGTAGGTNHDHAAAAGICNRYCKGEGGPEQLSWPQWPWTGGPQINA